MSNEPDVFDYVVVEAKLCQAREALEVVDLQHVLVRQTQSCGLGNDLLIGIPTRESFRTLLIRAVSWLIMLTVTAGKALALSLQGITAIDSDAVS